MEISQHSEFVKGYSFIDSWKLDLGAGDILKQSKCCSQVQKDSESNENPKTLPALKNTNRGMNKPTVLKVKVYYEKLRYSPIMKRYLDLKKYKTKNYLKPNTMKLTPYDESQKIYEAKLVGYKQFADKVNKKAEDVGRLIAENKLLKEMNDKIKAIKKKTLLHNKMLEEKRREEIEKGCYEYANYLVSMLNAGTNNYIIDQ